MLRVRDTVNRLYAQHTGQALEKVEYDTERDFYMDAAQALEYGLIDSVIESRNTGNK